MLLCLCRRGGEGDEEGGLALLLDGCRGAASSGGLTRCESGLFSLQAEAASSRRAQLSQGEELPDPGPGIDLDTALAHSAWEQEFQCASKSTPQISARILTT